MDTVQHPVQFDPSDPRFPESLIRAYLAAPGNNDIEPGSTEPAWDAPLVGVARGDDPIFASYKVHVDERHWTPLEAFRLAHPGTDAEARELAVLVWILPQTGQRFGRTTGGRRSCPAGAGR
jgi:hypothetical protein